jgi:hypothetical protein
VGKHSAHSLLPLFPEAKRFAKGRWWALCFAHEDTNKSLLLSKNDHGWRFHCYVCHVDGDAVDVLTRREELTYSQALKRLDTEEPVAPRLHVEKYKWLAICDVCKVESVKIKDMNHLVELTMQCDRWEIASDGIACVGPVCLRTFGEM